MDKLLTHPFKPVVFQNSSILILGSFPSKESFKNEFYYANSKNQFWQILSAITRYPINNKDQKIWLLKENGFALWDMIKSCYRDNSLDSSIEEEIVNSIDTFLEEYPNIKKIAFTGRKSQALFEYNFGYIDIDRVYLPSPSSAYAKMSMESKIEKYRELLKV